MRTIQAAASVAALLTGLALSASAFAAERVITSLNQDWRFIQADPADAANPATNDSAWTRVSTPHDWAIAGPFDQTAKAAGENGFLPSGVAWYRRDLGIKPVAGRRYFVEFDGIMERSQVWLNGVQIGERMMGYISQRFDITDRLRTDGPNILAVRADTSAAPSSRWYSGSGIYRNVRLVETGDVHIPQDGVFVTTPTITANSATVSVAVDVRNASAAGRAARIEIALLNPEGREVGRTTATVPTMASGASQVVKPSITIASPRRWSLEDPALYRASVRVLGEDGSVQDSQTVKFGVREAKFDPATGFWLNGKNFKIKGVALHHDGGAVGAAVPLDVWRQRLTTLKSQGVNAIRSAHNVPAPEFLALTDELGLLVMNELFDQWTVNKTPEDYSLFFRDWHKRDARDMIRRDRNHPSIVIWSIGNEIHDTAYPVQAKEIIKTLMDISHEEDPSRPVTLALFRPNVTKDYDNGLADMLDVVGQNYRENELIAANKQNPKRAIIGTENGHNRTNWVPVRDYAPFSGMFLWTGIDYLGETNRAGWPNISRPNGLMTRTGAQAIKGMQRESWWSEKPVLHVVRNADTSAAGPSTDGAGGPNQPVLPTMIAVATPVPPVALFDDWTPSNLATHTETIEVYSNCKDVEAFLNGKSLGVKPINEDASPRRWGVDFAPGEVKAVCKDAGATNVSDTLVTAGAPVAIALVADKAAVGSSFDNVGFIRARVVDAKGVTVPSATQTLSFKVTGPGALIATDSGSYVDHNPFHSPDRKVNMGSAVALVRGAGAGAFKVDVTAEGLKPASIQLRATR